MKLNASNGMAFELKILGYEFPQIKTDRWDSNWLDIEISVIHPEGSWQASDPSLTTFEIVRLADWLESVGKGEIEVSNVGFIEPCLEFWIQEINEAYFLKVCFSLELLPSWKESSVVDDCDFWVEFPLIEIDVLRVASQLRQQLEQYPPRAI